MHGIISMRCSDGYLACNRSQRNENPLKPLQFAPIYETRFKLYTFQKCIICKINLGFLRSVIPLYNAHLQRQLRFYGQVEEVRVEWSIPSFQTTEFSTIVFRNFKNVSLQKQGNQLLYFINLQTWEFRT